MSSAATPHVPPLPSAPDELGLSIAEVSSRTGSSTDTLRYYVGVTALLVGFLAVPSVRRRAVIRQPGRVA